MCETMRNSRLWSTTLAPQEDDTHRDARDRLRATLLRSREHAHSLVSEVARDLPTYTVHDISHLDALWEMADLLLGRAPNLNPAEAFVFGQAVLFHDAAMSLAVARSNRDIAGDPLWRDLVTREERRGASGDAPDVRRAKAELYATAEFLRLRHAEFAEKLPHSSWPSGGSGNTVRVIEDGDLRDAYGSIIGRIAHSHWWPVESLPRELGELRGAATCLPPEWTVSPVRIACLLRVADAMHLDRRRAPPLLRALRNPSGVAADHWDFQEKLQKPVCREDALVYTSGVPFKRESASSWWVCFESLRMVDRELRTVDAPLAHLAMDRFAARRIAGVDSSLHLAHHVECEGWTPLNANIRASDVARLVGTLGGAALYDDVSVALRELIQNASDAIRARRLLERRDESWGRVLVSLETRDGSEWLRVADNGVGMLPHVLVDYLLNFGNSYWGSDASLADLPGLLSSGFEATGRFGIGFFSVFMIGTRVSVCTRPHDRSLKETTVLEFGAGLDERPLLRPATESERLVDGGTTVRVELKRPFGSVGGLGSYPMGSDLDAAGLLRFHCPAAPISLFLDQDGNSSPVVVGDDWTRCDPSHLIRRTLGPYNRNSPFYDDPVEYPRALDATAQNLRTIEEPDGRVSGRAAIIGPDAPLQGAVVVGGLRACSLSGIAGLLVGATTQAARDTAEPITSPAALSRWATEQAHLVPALHSAPTLQLACAQIIWALGGDPGPLPIAWFRGRWMTTAQLDECDLPDTIILCDLAWFSSKYTDLATAEIADNVIVSKTSSATPLVNGRASVNWPTPRSAGSPTSPPWHYSATLSGAIVDAAASSWSNDAAELAAMLEYCEYDRPVARVDHNTLRATVSVLTRR